MFSEPTPILQLRVDVHDPERYKSYLSGAAAAFKKYNAVFLARGGEVSALEGPARSRNVVIEFESVDQAKKCYFSSEYQEAMKHRHASGEAELIIVEGVSGETMTESPA